MSSCVFCDRLSGECLARANGFAAFFDAFPVSPGHLLVVPIRHVEGFFEFDESEALGLYPFVSRCKELLDAAFSPDAYNLGVNAGEVAGQTVMHAHLHLIPRYRGDTPDPRGGVRAIFPTSARYWEH